MLPIFFLIVKIVITTVFRNIGISFTSDIHFALGLIVIEPRGPGFIYLTYLVSGAAGAGVIFVAGIFMQHGTAPDGDHTAWKDSAA